MAQQIPRRNGEERSEVTIKKTTDGAAVVDTTIHWIAVEEQSPPSGKLQLIDRRMGVAVYGNYNKGQGWTHWAPLPTFKDKQ
jgi:hypothetical protein